MQAAYVTNSQSQKPFQTDKTVGSSSGSSGESPWHYLPKAHACTPQARDHTCISFVHSINSKGLGDSPRQVTLDRKLHWKGLEPRKLTEPFAVKWSDKGTPPDSKVCPGDHACTHVNTQTQSREGSECSLGWGASCLLKPLLCILLKCTEKSLSKRESSVLEGNGLVIQVLAPQA